jgi:pimeloyl-ACP methyl ester carboxylesterase
MDLNITSRVTCMTRRLMSERWTTRVVGHREHRGRTPPRLPCVRLSIGLVVVAVLLVSTGCVHTEPFRDADGRVIPGSIATMEFATIGGMPQRLWFRGLDTTKPVLLLLHGGPGISEGPLFRRYNASLEHHFLVVYWEQRGTGRSYHADIPPPSMTIGQFLRDLDDVVELVRRRFKKDKVILLGHSWGTVLGTIYTSQHPEKVAAYVGVAQIANVPQGDQLSYAFALSEAVKRQHRRAVAALQAIGPPPHAVAAGLTRGRWVERFGGVFHTDLSTGKLIWAALTTDEASLVDLVKFGQGNRFSLEHLWKEFSQVDLTRYQVFEVPLFFLLGRYDWHVPAVLAAAYFAQIHAPCKRLIWFEQSAHNPPFEEPATFNQVLIEDVLPVAVGTSGTSRKPRGIRPPDE